MKRRKRKSSRAKRAARGDVVAVWKALIIFNLFISAFGFGMIYTQNNSILQAIQSNLPVSIPAAQTATAVVINPITGQFVAINAISTVGILLATLSLVGMYFLLKENL